MTKIKFTLITLFPEALTPYLNTSMMLKAQKKGIAEFNFVNLRDYGLGPHKSVDDTPYGGGDGMLLRCEPIYSAIENLKKTDQEAKVILPTPIGQLWTQSLARTLAGVTPPSSDSAPSSSPSPKSPPADDSASVSGSPTTTLHYIILCPHYEGYDERILPLIDYPVSIGNYILTGGELPALIIIDSLVRLLPGVLGGATSAQIESFADAASSALEYPQYTKPADFRGQKVPEVLLSGHHAKIAAWRAEQSRLRTSRRLQSTHRSNLSRSSDPTA